MNGSRLGGVKTLAVSGFLNEFEKGDLKRFVDIVQLFSHFGVDSEKKGRSYMARCPWHEDKTPSLSIDREKGLYNCFGCGESGDVFDLVQRMQGVEFKKALSFLKSYTGKTESKAVPAVIIEQDEPRPDEKAPLQAVSLQDILNYYQKALSQSKAALNYLKGRGIGMPSLLNRFSVGYSTGNLFAVVSSRQSDELTSLGIFTEKGSEFFKGCVVFPLYDEAGRVTGLYGRKISDKTKLKHLYLKGPHKGLFNRKALSAYREEIILTESIIDALSLIGLEIENVTSLYGTNGFTDELLG